MQAVRSKLLQGCLLGLLLCLAGPGVAGIDIYFGDDAPPVNGEIPQEEVIESVPALPEVPAKRPRPSFDGGASDRLALVISTQDYDNPTYDTLDSPDADGDAMARGFRGLGYRVMRIRDADREGMSEALQQFSDAIKSNDTVVVYYAGLGTALSSEKDNRLIPADFPANLPEAADAAIEKMTEASLALSEDVIFSIMRQKPRAVIVFYDGCSADPFAEQPLFQDNTETTPCKPVVLRNAAVLYASGPGTSSLRRVDANDTSPLSLFPRSILKVMEENPALNIDEMMHAIAADVRKVASGSDAPQSPVTRISLGEDSRKTGLCIAPSVSGGCENGEAPKAPSKTEISAELNAWQACLDSTGRGPCDEYLERFPDGPNARGAERRRIQLAAAQITMDVEQYVPSSGAEEDGDKTSREEAIRACDKFAAHPSNTENPDGIDGVSYRLIDETKALPACLKAHELAPDNLRIRYQLARAKQAAGQGKEAIADFLDLATNDAYVPAINNLGSIYQSGLGVEQSDEEAARWFRIAADNDFVPSMAILGWMYQSGRGVPKDYDKAYELYSRAAKGGLPSAMHNLGFMYQKGWGVEADQVSAAKWFQKAANEGFPQAMVMTGWLYQNGKGVEKNTSTARDWYQKAADRKLPSGMSALGGILDSGGEGVERSPEQAAEWFVKALRRQHAETRARLLDKPRTLRADTRKAIQAELKKLGYDPGPVDGAFGEKTREAIKAAFKGS